MYTLSLSINTDPDYREVFAQTSQPATRELTIAESSIFWDTLLQLIEEGKVVPIAGQDLLTIDTPAGSRLLYAHLAEQLAGGTVSPGDARTAERSVRSFRPGQVLFAAGRSLSLA